MRQPATSNPECFRRFDETARYGCQAPFIITAAASTMNATIRIQNA